MIDKAVAKPTGLGPQVTNADDSRAKGTATSTATSLAKLFSTELSSLGKTVQASGASLFSSVTPLYSQTLSNYGTGQNQPRSQSATPSAHPDHSSRQSDSAAASHDSTPKDAPHSSHNDTPAPHKDATDSGSRDHGNDNGNGTASNGNGGNSDGSSNNSGSNTSKSAHDSSGSSKSDHQDKASAGNSDKTAKASGTKNDDSNAKKNADGKNDPQSGTNQQVVAAAPADNQIPAQVDPTAGTDQTQAEPAPAQAAPAQHAAGKAGGDKTHEQGPAPQQADKHATPAPVAAAPATDKSANAGKTGTPHADTHNIAPGNTGNDHNLQAAAQAGKQPGADKQPAAGTETRAQQAQQVSEAIGPAGNGSNVDVKVTTKGRGRANDPAKASAQATVIQAGDKSLAARAGGQGSGGTASQNPHGQTHLAPQAGQQHAIQPQAAAQQQPQQQIQQQASQGAQAQTKGALDATSATSSNGSGGTAANHALATGGQAAGQAGATGGTGQTRAAQHDLPTEQAAQTQRGAQTGQPITEQVSVKIMKAVQAGKDRIQIQLKPSDLGRVDVKIELTHDGRATAVVTAHRQDTLDLLRRDAGQLQKALADAGLNTGTGDLSFNLHGEQQQGSGSGDGSPSARAPRVEDVAGSSLGDNGNNGVMLAHESSVLMPGRVDVRA